MGKWLWAYPLHIDLQRSQIRRVVDVEQAARADFAENGGVEAAGVGDDRVMGPCLATIVSTGLPQRKKRAGSLHGHHFTG